MDGKFSNEQYIHFFHEVWNQYKEKTNTDFADFEALCFHLPYTKMGWKALRTELSNADEETQVRLKDNYQVSTNYNRKVGNIYTGSLYLSLLSLLEQKEDLQAGSKIGLFSYGSGAVGEFFTGKLQPKFKDYLNKEEHIKLFANREEVTVEQYEQLFEDVLPKDGSTVELDSDNDPAVICLAGMKDNKRLYINKNNVKG